MTAIDRLPPHSTEAESGVLGCILLSPGELLGEVLQAVPPAAFYDLRHKTLYETLRDMETERVPVDLITLRTRLADKRLLESCGRCGGEGTTAVGELYEEDPLWYDVDDVAPCHECNGDGAWMLCISSPEYCEAHPMKGREATPRHTPEWFALPETKCPNDQALPRLPDRDAQKETDGK